MIGIFDVNECLVVLDWNGFHHHVIVRGSHRAGFGIHNDLHVIGIVDDRLEVVFHVKSVREGLGFFRACVNFDFIAAQGTAIFDVQMQKKHVTPFLRCVQRSPYSGKGVVDDTVNVAANGFGCLFRIHDDRLVKLVVLQFVL